MKKKKRVPAETPEQLQNRLTDAVCKRDHQDNGKVEALRVGDTVWVHGARMFVEKMCRTRGAIVFHWRRVE